MLFVYRFFRYQIHIHASYIRQKKNSRTFSAKLVIVLGRYFVPFVLFLASLKFLLCRKDHSEISSQVREKHVWYLKSRLKYIGYLNIYCFYSAYYILTRLNYTEHQKKLITSSGRRSLKSTLSNLMIFGHR